MTQHPPKLITVGTIATELGIPIDRVCRILRRHPHIKPKAYAGNFRLFDNEAVAHVRYESNRIDSRHSLRKGVTMSSSPANEGRQGRNEQQPKLALRPREAAKALGIGERLLWSMTNRGEIPHVKLGRATLYPVAQLEAWLAERAGRGNAVRMSDQSQAPASRMSRSTDRRKVQ